jgi:3-oxoadipate enol-lactonase
MRPAIRELAQNHDVRTFSLTEAAGPDYFSQWHAQIDRLLADLVRPAALVGVSFGAIVAATYAACAPARITRMVLVSPPSPRYRLDSRTARYARAPLLSLPLFAGRAARRLVPEVRAARHGWHRQAAFAVQYGLWALRWPVSPGRMAAWAAAWQSADFTAAVAAIRTPTLVITGEPSLDRVVPVDSSREYLQLVPGARHVTLAGTGHIGLVTRPAAFAGIVSDFLGEPPT